MSVIMCLSVRLISVPRCLTVGFRGPHHIFSYPVVVCYVRSSSYTCHVLSVKKAQRRIAPVFSCCRVSSSTQPSLLSLTWRIVTFDFFLRHINTLTYLLTYLLIICIFIRIKCITIKKNKKFSTDKLYTLYFANQRQHITDMKTILQTLTRCAT